jgi:Lon protease-like protein
MVLLRPGWEPDYDHRPAIHAVACLGRIIAEQRLEDGRYNLLLRGVARARILQEVPHDKLYRGAAVELVQELPMGEATDQVWRHRLTEGVRPWFEAQAEAQEQLQRLLDNDLPLGVLCDVLAFALPLPPEGKQQLLEEADVAQRVRRLLEQLGELAQQPGADGGRTFPPTFSDN